MSMELISEKLLESEIKRYRNNPELIKDNEFFFLMCKKELAVMKKLKISGIDMTGNIEDVECRLDKYNVYFIEPNEFDKMEEKARRFDEISKIIQIK